MNRHENEAHEPLEELSPLLRRAVEAVRNQPVPNSAINVALRKADNVQFRSLNHRLMLLVAACFLAAFGVSLWAMQQHLGEQDAVAAIGEHGRDQTKEWERIWFGDKAKSPDAFLDIGQEEGKRASSREWAENVPGDLPSSSTTKRDGTGHGSAKSKSPGTEGHPGQPIAPGGVPLYSPTPTAGPGPNPPVIFAERPYERPATPAATLPMTAPMTKGEPGTQPHPFPPSPDTGLPGKDKLDRAEETRMGGETLKKLRELAQNAKDVETKQAALAALNQPGNNKNDLEQLAKLSLELSRVVRDQKIVRSVSEYKKLREEGGVALGDVRKLMQDVDGRLQGGAEGKEQVALLALKAQLEDQAEGMRTDQHEKFIPNPFLRAKDNPLSTFSIDVDTASYSLTRRYLKEENRLPPQDAVRIEEMVNYFDYKYPQPRGEHPIGITPEVSACPWNKDHRLVRIAVQGRQVDPSNLPPRNLVFLIDVSGSMQPADRLPLVKQSLNFLIDQLTAKDKVAIVVYAGEVGTVLESTAGSEKDTIRQAVEKLGAGGSTNGAGGIMAAYDEAHKNFIPGGVNRVILATDGDFNVGISSQGELVRLVEEKRNKGIFLTALGYGMGNLKDSTIMKLADHGHGHYAYIDSLAEAKKIFVEEGAALITLAKDVKIQVEFNPKTVAAYKLIGYEKRLMAAQDFNDDTKLAGVMGCGHRVTALYEIVPAGKPVELPKTDDLRYQQPSRLTKEADSGELLTVKLRYKDTLGDKSQLILAPVKDKGEAFDKASTDFRFAAAVAAFAILLRDNPKDAGINLAGVAELAESAKGDDARGLRKEFVELVKKADQLAKQPKPANN